MKSTKKKILFVLSLFLLFIDFFLIYILNFILGNEVEIEKVLLSLPQSSISFLLRHGFVFHTYNGFELSSFLPFILVCIIVIITSILIAITYTSIKNCLKSAELEAVKQKKEFDFPEPDIPDSTIQEYEADYNASTLEEKQSYHVWDLNEISYFEKMNPEIQYDLLTSDQNMFENQIESLNEYYSLEDIPKDSHKIDKQTFNLEESKFNTEFEKLNQENAAITNHTDSILKLSKKESFSTKTDLKKELNLFHIVQARKIFFEYERGYALIKGRTLLSKEFKNQLKIEASKAADNFEIKITKAHEEFLMGTKTKLDMICVLFEQLTQTPPEIQDALLQDIKQDLENDLSSNSKLQTYFDKKWLVFLENLTSSKTQTKETFINIIQTQKEYFYKSYFVQKCLEPIVSQKKLLQNTFQFYKRADSMMSAELILGEEVSIDFTLKTHLAISYWSADGNVNPDLWKIGNRYEYKYYLEGLLQIKDFFLDTNI